MENSALTLRAVITKEENGFSGLCLDVDVASDGETIEDAKLHLQEAVGLYIETAIESNLPVIRPVPRNENPLIARAEDIVAEFTLNTAIHVDVHA